jgi:hypothetical protein
MRHKATLVLLAWTVGLACCGGDDGDDNGNGNQVIVITEDIDTTTTWTYPHVYLIRAWDFYVSATLTIEPGVIVKFHPGDGPELTLSGSGVLVAEGTADRPIVFTSYKDDAHGGDTNGDGNATMPAPADWGQINTNATQGSTFGHCHFYYGGSGSYLGVLRLPDSRATVTDSVFAHNTGGPFGDFFYGALDANDTETGTVIAGNTFFDNALPLSIDITFSLDDSNTFHDPANPSTGNQMNGVWVQSI